MLASLAVERCQPYWTDRLVQRYPGFLLHFADVHGFGMALARPLTRSRRYSHTAQEGLSRSIGDEMTFI